MPIKTVMLSLGIEYSMRDLIYDVNYCACGAKQHMYHEVSTPSFIFYDFITYTNPYRSFENSN